MAEIELQNVTKRFDKGIVAVDALNLTIAAGEFVVLVGPSGCGKSTTLRMVAGLEDLTSGTIRIGGHRVNDVAPQHRDVAMVFQNFALYPHMTVYENLAFGPRLRSVPKADRDARIREVADMLGLARLLDRKPRALSGGQRQRVAVGRAIVRRPRAFLFDEPLSNLDASLRLEIRAELKQLHERLSTTTLYVTHDQEEAMTLGDRIAVMRGGALLQSGPPMELFNRPANRFVAGFLGTPPMNFLTGRLVGDAGSLVFDEGTSTIRIDTARVRALAAHVGKPVVMGIRPEAMSFVAEGPFAGAGNSIPVTPQVREFLGERMDVYADTRQNQRLVARVGAQTQMKCHQETPLYLDVTRTHFFDVGETGRNLEIGE